MKLQIYLLRHGKTPGNEERRYIGRTDEPLSAAGRQEVEQLRDAGKIPYGSRLTALFVSPMQRCKETAQLLYPGRQQIVLEDFREIDFGDFEGKNAAELLADPASGYQAWIDSNGTLPFPHGEARQDFMERSRRAFAQMLEILRAASPMQQKEQSGTTAPVLPEAGKEPGKEAGEEPGKQQEKRSIVYPGTSSQLQLTAAAVVHGGTIMSILSGLCGGDYYDYMCKNAEGYRLELEEMPDNRWKVAQLSLVGKI